MSAEPARAHSVVNRLMYKGRVAPSLIAGSNEERDRAITILRHRHADAIAALQGLESRNKEGDVPGRILQDYYCIGCIVPDGAIRKLVFALGAYPLLREAMKVIFGKQLALMCYFPQTYEPGAGPGPGGIIGVAGLDEDIDTSASRSLKYWNWVDRHVPAYLSEEEAEIALWKLTYSAFSIGKFWLASLPDMLPEDGLEFPPEFSHDMYALLGVPAMQKLVAQHLGKDFVLLDDGRIINRVNLRWSLVTELAA
ncbi:MAG: hypothetical protein DI585_04495 [Pseudomonas fluorescens]|nr:MAG: hypothetical protein DI585_04495 [Pseudomonas fluorescens]